MKIWKLRSFPTQINFELDRIRSELSQNNQKNETLSAHISMMNQTRQMICDNMNPEKKYPNRNPNRKSINLYPAKTKPHQQKFNPKQP